MEITPFLVKYEIRNKLQIQMTETTVEAAFKMRFACLDFDTLLLKSIRDPVAVV
jgi:hypothetical protein